MCPKSSWPCCQRIPSRRAEALAHDHACCWPAAAAGSDGRAKCYAERLFGFVTIGPLHAAATQDAIRISIEREEEAFGDAALEVIFAQMLGHPYFLQECGKHSWDAAEGSPITAADVEAEAVSTLAELDASFFRVRFDRLTPAEKRYLRAMADRGPGPHR